MTNLLDIAKRGMPVTIITGFLGSRHLETDQIIQSIENCLVVEK